MKTPNIEKLNQVFYKWACGNLTNGRFKDILHANGLSVDLRQLDIDNKIECRRVSTGRYITLEC